MTTPEYTVQVVTLIDILGFTSIIKDKSPEDILGYYKTLRKVGGFSGEHDTTEQKFLNFSDTCVRTTPLIRDDGKPNLFGILFHELMDVVFLQSHMIWNHGITLRGGITLGEVFNDGDSLFGPAVVTAHNLEKDVAIYPRVVVDPVIWEAYKDYPYLKLFSHDYKTDKEFVEQLVRQSDDGIWFVDYIKGIEPNLEYPNEFNDFIRLHKEMILKSGVGDEGLSRISAKYLWLAKYHNDAIDDFRDDPRYELEELRITESDIPALRDI